MAEARCSGPKPASFGQKAGFFWPRKSRLTPRKPAYSLKEPAYTEKAGSFLAGKSRITPSRLLLAGFGRLCRLCHATPCRGRLSVTDRQSRSSLPAGSGTFMSLFGHFSVLFRAFPCFPEEPDPVVPSQQPDSCRKRHIHVLPCCLPAAAHLCSFWKERAGSNRGSWRLGKRKVAKSDQKGVFWSLLVNFWSLLDHY